MSEDKILRSKHEPIISKFNVTGSYLWDKLSKLDDKFVCLIDAVTDESLTIGELKKRANSLGVALVNRGVTKRDLIAISGQNSIQHAVIRFAIKLLGVTFMPLSPTFQAYEVDREVRDANCTIVMTSAEDLPKFDTLVVNSNDDKQQQQGLSIKLVVVFDGNYNTDNNTDTDMFVTYDQLLADGRDDRLTKIPYFDVQPDTDQLFLVHTSGSTGRPKCAEIPHRMFIQAAEEREKFVTLEDTPTTINLLPYPLGHISGTAWLPIQLSKGHRLILMGRFDERVLFRSVEKYGINVLPTFPSFGRRLIESDCVDRYDLSSLRVVSSGGAAFPGNIAKEIIAKYGVKFKEGYGMTEFLWVTNGSDINDDFQSGNLGTPAPGCELKFVDLTSGQALGPDTDGELLVRSLTGRCFSGYLNNDRAYQEAIDADGWYRTGDIGHYDNRDRVFIVGRIKEVLRIGVDNHYVNISPVEIEQFLLTHPAVSEVAVIGVNNSVGTHWPRAYVVIKNGHLVTADDIQKFVSDTMAYTKQLKAGVVFVDSIHRTSIGKVDRNYYRNLIKNEIID
ncbi:uncharacterized protein LOC128951822 [Oppia nitens]|uniref:uncharacterized protein LOC128951822 n=1 Tax=Oppia nitens TaxID=1686743 RepID=UPI0023DC21FA|nr:uncharacterized protein LOC128951822 [Oppia nitens]